MHLKIISCLCLVLQYQSLVFGQVTGHGGKRHAVMFPDGRKPVTRAEILISSLQDTNVRIMSKFPGIDRVLQVRADIGAVVSLPPEIVLDGNKREDKGILIESEHPVYVYGHSGDECCAGEGFLAIPVDFWGMNYYTVTHENAAIAVVAVEDNTEVTITKGFWGGVQFESNSYSMGDNITFTLSAGQTAQLQTPMGYLLGSRVYSTKPVGVISGQFYANPSKSKSNQMLEFIPPASSIGRNYIVPPFFNTTYVTLHYTNMGEENVVTTRGKNVNRSSKLQKRGGSMLSTGASNPYYGFGEHPVILTATPYTISPFLLLIPSIDQYSNNYKFHTPTKPGLTHYIVMLVKAKDEGGITIDGGKIYPRVESLDALLINDVIYLVISAEVSPGQHYVTHSDPNARFGLILYGFDSTQSYAYPLGLRLPTPSIAVAT